MAVKITFIPGEAETEERGRVRTAYFKSLVQMKEELTVAYG